ncbi:Rpn family recombination-promoting nuclease/putative transposase [Candidiatus Paracoxiella cheracis]|uniref:Rpn family recombination-promoting nuclease/putative transposase n=1 Tax=Candidiatus Paracoxiella cheracis TaxID=3405120 RepID=UPI003BF48107
MAVINNIHDKYFRSAMSNLRVAKDFMEQHLPRAILAVTDLSTLKLQKESFIDANFKQVMSDVLYQAKIKGRDSYIYLLAEHQSTPDRLMALRLLRYSCRIMAHHVENNKGAELPVVVPLVFYHGQQRYPYSTDLFDLFGDSRELAKSVLLEPFHLIDVNTIPDETLKQRVWSGVLTLMQKHIYERDVLKYFEAVLPLLRELMTNHEESYILSTVHYVIDAGSINDIERLIRLTHELSPEIGDEAMTLAERLRLEGRTIGKAEGKIEGRIEAAKEIAKNLLAKGVDPSMVAQATDLPFETISSITTE